MKIIVDRVLLARMIFGASFVSFVVVPACLFMAFVSTGLMNGPEEGDSKYEYQQFTWSPDRRSIAMVICVNSACNEVWVLDIEAHRWTNVLTSDYWYRHLQYLPTRNEIAYTNNSTGNWDIYITDLDRHETINLTNSPEDEEQILRSPDGDRIAFVSSRDNIRAIYSMRRDGTDLRRHTDDWGEDPEWSPNGKMIAFARDNQLWVVNLDDGQTSQVIELGRDLAYVGFSWSPDGKGLYFMPLTDTPTWRYINISYVELESLDTHLVLEADIHSGPGFRQQNPNCLAYRTSEGIAVYSIRDGSTESFTIPFEISTYTWPSQERIFVVNARDAVYMNLAVQCR